MTQNTVASYNELIDIMESMIENASDEESSLLEESVERIQQAKRQVLNEKDEVSKMLYESGEMSSDEYNEYHKYLKDELDSIRKINDIKIDDNLDLIVSRVKYRNVYEYSDTLTIFKGFKNNVFVFVSG